MSETPKAHADAVAEPRRIAGFHPNVLALGVSVSEDAGATFKPFAAGGGVDASARMQALALGEILGQTIVVENVGAAAGTVGWTAARLCAAPG